MSTPVDELDLPDLSAHPTFDERRDAMFALPEDVWLVQGSFSPVAWRYDDSVAILRDKRWHSASAVLGERFGVTDQRLIETGRANMLAKEGDTHSRLRSLVVQALSPKAADRLRPFMREVVDGLADTVCPAGRADVVADLCDPFPVPVICELIGAPKDDWQKFSQLAAEIMLQFTDEAMDVVETIVAAQDQLDSYIRDLVDARRREPADDLLTALIAAEEAGDKLTNDELVMIVNNIIVGGVDTTRNQLGCAIALFAQDADQWALLARNPDLAPRAVEETMRYLGAVRFTARFASTDIEYRDVVFPAGSLIQIGLAEANHDGSVFDAPDRFDISSPAPSHPQLTLGAGSHFCVGAGVARAELQEALPLLARRMPNLRLDGPGTWKPDVVGIFGPVALPVIFDAGH